MIEHLMAVMVGDGNRIELSRMYDTRLNPGKPLGEEGWVSISAHDVIVIKTKDETAGRVKSTYACFTRDQFEAAFKLSELLAPNLYRIERTI